MNSPSIRLILLSFFLIFCFPALLHAQKENYLWWFGPTNMGIKFDYVTKKPSPISGKYSPYSYEGCSVITDPATGKLLYYSDGIRTIDATHRIMPNGSGLFGNTSSAQNGWSCPVPGQCNKYYVFSNSCAYESTGSGTLYYSIVDMTLPGNGTAAAPLGDVESGSKNVFLLSGTSEAITLIKGSARDEYWLLAPLAYSSIIATLHITSAGVSSAAGFDTGIIIQDKRNIRYSSVSGKFAIIGMYGTDPAEIADFNPLTGQILNAGIIPGTPFFNVPIDYQGAYDAEWSPDGARLYISMYRWNPTSSGGRIYQYDLSQPAAPPALIFDNGGTFAHVGMGLKLGPDGKIYWLYRSSSDNLTRYIGVINDPDKAGSACNFDPLGLDMGADQGGAVKFPDFLVYSNHPPAGKDDIYTSSCLMRSDTIIRILDNDSDPDFDPLSVSIVKTQLGLASVLSDKTLMYTKTNQPGNDTIWYMICDNQCPSYCDTAIVVVCNDPPLPVTFISFSGEKASAGVHLYWTTSSERNSDYFGVERSEDGKEFLEIGVVKARGYSNEAVSYTFMDYAPAGAGGYYRLRQTDNDGRYTYSKMIHVASIPNAVEVFPNPVSASSIIHIRMPGDGGRVIHCTLTDVTGRLCHNTLLNLSEGENLARLQLQNMVPGLYVMTIESADRKEMHKIFVK